MQSAVCQLRYLAIAALLVAIGSAVRGHLLHIGLVFRHGHRAPIHAWLNDSYTVANTWRDGLGQLTNQGKKNQLELGAFLRKRYGDFLGSRYNSSEHHIRSSNIDRTLMSAQACLAGLFPPTGDQAAWQPGGLAWQPIPVHTVDKHHDALLLSNEHVDCTQRIGELTDVPKRSVERQRIEAESAALLRRLVGIVGPVNFDSLYKVTDTLMVLRAANLTLPYWVHVSGTYEQLQSLSRFSWREFSWTPELRRMRVGVLWHSLLARMEDVAAGRLPSSGGRRLAIYSGHDITLAPLLATLGNEDFVWPNFASCLMLELHSANYSGGQPVVRIFYRNDTRREPVPIRVPNCDLACPLGQLTQLLDPYRITDTQFLSLCTSGRSNDVAHAGSRYTLTVAYYVLSGAALALLAVTLVACGYFCCLRNRIQRRDDRHSVAYHSLLGSIDN